MSPVRLRVLKRRTSLEESFDDFFDCELRNKGGGADLNLSVFDVDAAELVRTHAEFVVSLLRPDPKKMRGGLCLIGCDGDCDATPSPADGIAFSYARDNHLELRFLRENELRAFAEQLFARRSVRERSAQFQDVVVYGQQQLATGDKEWRAACEAKPSWKKVLGATS